MSNIDGTSSSAINGNVKTLNASQSIELTGRYQMPTDTPLANEVIQALGTILPNGARETHWATIAGVGDVSSSTSTSVNNEIAVFDATSGKIIKNSNVLVSNVARNPATQALDMNANNINNIDILNGAEAQFVSPTQSGTLTINNNASIQNKLFIARNTVEGLVRQNLRSRGSTASPLAILDNDIISRQSNNGHNGTNESAGIQWITSATQDHTLSGSGTELKLQTTDNDSVVVSDKIIFNSQGVTINNSSNSITFPATRGTTGNVLKTNATTGLSFWEDSYNQNLNIENDVKFNSITLEDTAEWDISVDVNALQLKQNTDVARIRFGTGFNFLDRADSSGGGLGIVTTKSRGSLTTPLAVDSVTGLFECYHRGYNGSTDAIASRVDVQATENFTISENGSNYKISTTDNGQTLATQKLLLDSSGITINDASNTITFPATRGTTGNVLKTNATTGLSFWENSFDQELNVISDVAFNTVETDRVDLFGVNGYMSLVNENPFAGAQIIRGMMSNDSFDAVGSIAYRARGNRASPTAVLSGDLINYDQSICYDGTGFAVGGHTNEIRATNNISSGSGGVSYTMSTSNIGSASVVQKLKLAEGGLTVGTDALGFVLPLTRGVAGQTLKSGASGAVSWQNGVGIFAQTNTTTVNGVTPTDVIGTGQGSTTIPANGFLVGDSFTVKIGGDITSANNDTITWTIKTATGIIFSNLTTTLAVTTAQPFELEIDFTVRSLGLGGVAAISNNGQFTYQANSQSAYQGGMTNGLNDVDFDTTIDNTLVVEVTQSNASQVCNTFQCVIHRTYP
jgi:hypothetical protein